MLPNVAALWEITLAAIKLGAVISPATTLLSKPDLADRMQRGGIRCVVTDSAGTAKCDELPAGTIRIVVEAKDRPLKDDFRAAKDHYADEARETFGKVADAAKKAAQTARDAFRKAQNS